MLSSRPIPFAKKYDRQAQWMYILIEDDKLIETYNTNCDKVIADRRNEFDNKSVYNKKYLKTKVKPRVEEVTDFYDKEILILVA